MKVTQIVSSAMMATLALKDPPLPLKQFAHKATGAILRMKILMPSASTLAHLATNLILPPQEHQERLWRTHAQFAPQETSARALTTLKRHV